jgi:hypothetical protein
VLVQCAGLVCGSDARKSAFLSVVNKNTLRLVVPNGGDGQGYHHASWRGVHLTGYGTIPRLDFSNPQEADNANIAGWSLQGNLQLGNAVYGDRAFTIGSVLPTLVGQLDPCRQQLQNPHRHVAGDLHARRRGRCARGHGHPCAVALMARCHLDRHRREHHHVRKRHHAHVPPLMRKRFGGGGGVLLGPSGDGNVSMYIVVN